MERKNLQWLRGIIILIPWLISMTTFALLFSWIFDYDIMSSETDQRVQFLNLLAETIGTIFIVVIFTLYIDKKSLHSIGFSLKDRSKDIFWGLMAGLIVMTLGYSILSLTNQITFKEIIINIDSIFYLMALYLLVALNEEIISRGYILRNFMYSTNNYVALFFSSTIFALFHIFNANLDWFSIVSLIMAGIALGIVYIHTQNLWYAISFHFSWNLFQSFFGFNVSGGDYYSIIEFQLNGINRLNGGHFGFEGSIYSVILEIILIIYIDYYFRKKNKRHIEHEQRQFNTYQ